MRIRKSCLLIVVGVLTLAVSLPVSAQTPAQRPVPGEIETSGMVGLAEREVAHLPGVMALFDVSNASGTPRLAPGIPHRAGEIVARFLLDLDDWDVLQIARSIGAERIVRKSPIGLFELHGPKTGWVSDETLERLWNTGKVVTVGANYTRGSLSFLPNDPHVVSGAQWYLDQPSDIDLDLLDAWDITTGSSSVVVAVIDTGLELAHPDFAGRLWVNPGEIPNNQIDDDGNGYIDDINGWNTCAIPPGVNNIQDEDQGFGGTAVGHGTWVSSILMANANNAHQVAGFDHSAKLLTVRAANKTTLNTSFITAGIDYLTMNVDYYDVVNASFAIDVNEPFVENALNALEANGALLVAGAGNTLTTEDWYPAAHSIAITVGGTDDTDTLATFSATGPSMDFVAPAVDIVAASFLDPLLPNAFDQGDGTSFAAPMVTGIASLGFAVRPTMDKTDLVYALRKSAVDLGAPGWDQQFGWGRVNALEALEVLSTMIFFDGFEEGDTSRWSSSVP